MNVVQFTILLSWLNLHPKVLAWCRRRCALAYWWPVCCLSKMLSVPCHVSLCHTSTNPPVFLRPSVLISSPSTSMTDLTHQCFVLLSSLSPFFLFISPSFCPYLYLCFAHPLGCLWRPFPAVPGCAPLTVSFTRVSPVSSFSICQPHAAPGPRSPAQSQQRPKERPAYFCVCGCHLQYDTGEQMIQTSTLKWIHLFFFFFEKCAPRVGPTKL